MQTEFTSQEVVTLTGITPRQLQWWDERGIVVPRRQGHRRLYSMDDLTEVAVICELRERGFSLQRVRKLVRLLQRDFRKRLAQTVSGNSECHLLTDGTRLYLETSHLNIIDILTNSRQPLLSISISDTMRRIRAGIRVNKRASGSVRMGSRRSKSRAA